MNAVTIGKHVANFDSRAINGVTTVVAPSANPSGLVIQTGNICPSNESMSLYAGPIAPTDGGDLRVALIFSANGNGTPGSNSEVVLPYPLRIPAGWGLWVATSATTATLPLAVMSLTYDLLA
ncbi:hypothetical protein RBU55_06075 [Pseudomonas chlororaphis subsp. aurantiaca]|uniref:hypothetical protein n=1 Tax=Pseudomonas chlororaphis TaxID=587753 RepID=UPI000F581E39|nr:hypothetical protein [Pseudomonas chlororaphis]WMJ01119.1 hypothetical protein RBU55_06075 [Pseudomonas chlororaphis subsp. aurantiaca]